MSLKIIAGALPVLLLLAPRGAAQEREPDATTKATEAVLSEYTEKTVGDMLIASIRFKGTYAEIPKYFERLMGAVKSDVTGSTLTLYHDDGSSEVHDIEVCVSVSDTIETEEVKTRLLEGGRMICLVHYGAYDRLSESWGRLHEHIAASGLKTCSPVREVYLAWSPEEPANNVTELQVPLVVEE